MVAQHDMVPSNQGFPSKFRLWGIPNHLVKSEATSDGRILPKQQRQPTAAIIKARREWLNSAVMISSDQIRMGINRDLVSSDSCRDLRAVVLVFCFSLSFVFFFLFVSFPPRTGTMRAFLGQATEMQIKNDVHMTERCHVGIGGVSVCRALLCIYSTTYVCIRD